MLTSLAARQWPASASPASSLMSPARRSARSSKEEKKGKSSRIFPSRQHASRRVCPSATLVVDSSRRAWPNAKADREGSASSRIDRCPPTTGTP